MGQPPVRAYQIRVSDDVLRTIHTRVSSVHLPTRSRNAGWKYGVDAAWFDDLVQYWRDGYSWRRAEAELNTVPQFTATVEGRRLHFAHLQPSAGSRPPQPPIVLLHGWPYSFVTMVPLARILAASGYEVIIPSLPGYGFSPAPDDEVRGLRFIAQRIDTLLSDMLGYGRYVVHGGDHGAVVADWLAIDHEAHVLGIHANGLGFRHHGAEFGTGKTGVPDPTPEEVAFVKAELEMTERESAYFRLHLTRPETIAYALADSPVGWAAYMLDKWQKWTDTRARTFEEIYGRDRLLTEVMVFLVSDAIATSIWPYAGFKLEPFGLAEGQTIAVPYGHSSFPDPLQPPAPRRFMARSRPDIRLWREHDRGGHFPMLEQTDALARDIQDFVSTLSR